MAIFPNLIYRFKQAFLCVCVGGGGPLEIEKTILKLIWTWQVTQNSYEKEIKQTWSIYSILQDLLLSEYSKDSVVLAKGQTSRTLEQNREPTNRPTYIQSNKF